MAEMFFLLIPQSNISNFGRVMSNLHGWNLWMLETSV